jgi:hypothetical protein
MWLQPLEVVFALEIFTVDSPLRISTFAAVKDAE